MQNNIIQLGTNTFIYAFLHSFRTKSDLALHLMFLKDKQGIIKKKFLFRHKPNAPWWIWQEFLFMHK